MNVQQIIKHIEEKREALEIELKENVKNCFGYIESGNQSEFLKGANIGVLRTLDKLLPEIRTLMVQHSQAEEQYQDARKELKTVADIITKYSDMKD